MHNLSKRERSAGGANAKLLFLIVVFIGLVALIVYEMKPRKRGYGPAAEIPGPTPTTVATPVTPSPTSSIVRLASVIDKTRQKVSEETVQQPAQPIGEIPRAAPAVSSNLVATEGAVVTPPATPKDPIDCRGIVWKKNMPLALVNGLVVGVGEKVAGYTVDAISKDRLVLRDELGAKTTVTLYKAIEP